MRRTKQKMEKKKILNKFIICCHRDSRTFVPRWRLQMVGEETKSLFSSRRQ